MMITATDNNHFVFCMYVCVTVRAWLEPGALELACRIRVPVIVERRLVSTLLSTIIRHVILPSADVLAKLDSQFGIVVNVLSQCNHQWRQQLATAPTRTDTNTTTTSTTHSLASEILYYCRVEKLISFVCVSLYVVPLSASAAQRIAFVFGTN